MEILNLEKSHMNKLDSMVRNANISKLQTYLDNTFRNGIKDPAQIPYIHQLLKQYYDMTGVEYKLNKENSII